MLSEKFIFTPLKEKYVRCDSCIPSWLRSSRSFRYSFTAELFAPTEFSLIFFISFITLVSAHRHFAKAMDKMRVCVCVWVWIGFSFFAKTHAHTHTRSTSAGKCVPWCDRRKTKCWARVCCICLTLSAVSFVKRDIIWQERTCCKMNWTIKQL